MLSASITLLQFTAFLTSLHFTSHTKFMAHIYLLFDFPNEEKAQEARHKLEVWKQASRLDKKLLYKFERENADNEGAEQVEPPKAEKTARKSKSKSEASDKKSTEPVKLFVRLGFSGHEKLSEQRLLDRIEAEEIFQSASPETIKASDASFFETESRFEDLA
jgi:hypothetical protein